MLHHGDEEWLHNGRHFFDVRVARYASVRQYVDLASADVSHIAIVCFPLFGIRLKIRKGMVYLIVGKTKGWQHAE